MNAAAYPEEEYEKFFYIKKKSRRKETNAEEMLLYNIIGNRRKHTNRCGIQKQGREME